MANKPRKYPCPACPGEFTAKERVKGCCPHCKTLLTHKREREKTGFTLRYVVAEPETPVAPDIKAPEEPQPAARLVSEPNERPEVWFLKEEEEIEYWRVLYSGVVHTDWVFCPSCWTKAFMNNRLVGSLEFKCKRCGAITSFEFQSQMASAGSLVP